MGVVAIGILLGACGGALDPAQARREMIRDQIRASYARTLDSMRPAHVFVTYPGTIGSMPAQKREELEIVRKVLTDRRISHEVVDRADVLEAVVATNGSEVFNYRLSEKTTKSCRGRTVLFVNLHVAEDFKAGLPPDAKENGLTLMVLSDPIKLGGRASS